MNILAQKPCKCTHKVFAQNFFVQIFYMIFQKFGITWELDRIQLQYFSR